MSDMIKKHWSIDTGAFGADDKARAQWELEERINFGIGEITILREALRAHWDAIDIDPWKRKALALALE